MTSGLRRSPTAARGRSRQSRRPSSGPGRRSSSRTRSVDRWRPAGCARSTAAGRLSSWRARRACRACRSRSGIRSAPRPAGPGRCCEPYWTRGSGTLSWVSAGAPPPTGRGGSWRRLGPGSPIVAGERPDIDLGGLDPRLGETELRIACDVTNPLLGPRGRRSHLRAAEGCRSGGGRGARRSARCLGRRAGRGDRPRRTCDRPEPAPPEGRPSASCP